MHRKPVTGGLPTFALLGALVSVTLLTAGCRQDMHDAPKVEPLEASAFFPDAQGSRPLVPGTVARGELHDDDLLYKGLGPEGKPSATFPFPVTGQVMARGRREFNVFCSPCHDRAGTGKGMVVQRGFKQPPSYNEERLRNEPPGYFVSVMTNGFGQMSSYAGQVKPRDRWAIAAYIRALQLSQNAHLTDLTPDERAQFQGPATAAPVDADQNENSTERSDAE
jgi:mono/diheme cytochrome c family protein